MKKLTILAWLCALALSLSAMGQEPSKDRSMTVWGGVAPSATANQGQDYRGVLLSGGILLPVSDSDRESAGFSLSRILDESEVDRTNLLASFGYRVLNRLELGLLGGVQYLEVRDSLGTYLKPLFGLQAKVDLWNEKKYALSADASFLSAQGSTGTLGLDGGSASLAATTFAVGLVLGFHLN